MTGESGQYSGSGDSQGGSGSGSGSGSGERQASAGGGQSATGAASTSTASSTSPNISGGASGRAGDYWSRGFNQPQPTGHNDMTNMMQFLRDTLKSHKEDMSKLIEEKVHKAIDESTQVRRGSPQWERMKRQALRIWADKTDAQRQQEFVDIGFSDEDLPLVMEEDPFEAFNSGGVHNHPTTLVSQPAPRRYEFKVTDLGTFDGNAEEYLTWSRHITQLWERKVDPHWREPLLDTLPLCLRGSARNWYNALTKLEIGELSTWERWDEKLKAVFSPDEMSLQRVAEHRQWEFRKESVSDYYFDKKKLITAAHPNRSEKEYCTEIWQGLPSSFRVYCRTPMARNAQCSELLTEMRNFEESWRNNAGKSSPAQIRPTTRVQEEKSSAKAESSQRSKPTQQGRTGRPAGSLKDTYDSTGVFYRKGKRHYRIPSTNQVLELSRPCRTCGGDHFDFEHDLINIGKVIKKEANYVEGYLAHELSDFLNSGSDPESPDTSWENELEQHANFKRADDVIDLMDDEDDNHSSGN